MSKRLCRGRIVDGRCVVAQQHLFGLRYVTTQSTTFSSWGPHTKVEVPQIIYEDVSPSISLSESWHRAGLKTACFFVSWLKEKIVEVPTVEVREVIKQVSKPEAARELQDWISGAHM